MKKFFLLNLLLSIGILNCADIGTRPKYADTDLRIQTLTQVRQLIFDLQKTNGDWADLDPDVIEPDPYTSRTATGLVLYTLANALILSTPCGDVQIFGPAIESKWPGIFPIVNTFKTRCLGRYYHIHGTARCDAGDPFYKGKDLSERFYTRSESGEKVTLPVVSHMDLLGRDEVVFSDKGEGLGHEVLSVGGVPCEPHSELCRDGVDLFERPCVVRGITSSEYVELEGLRKAKDPCADRRKEWLEFRDMAKNFGVKAEEEEKA